MKIKEEPTKVRGWPISYTDDGRAGETKDAAVVGQVMYPVKKFLAVLGEQPGVPARTFLVHAAPGPLANAQSARGEIVHLLFMGSRATQPPSVCFNIL